MYPSGSNERQDRSNSSEIQFKFRPFQDLQILRQYMFVTYDEQVALKYKTQNPGWLASGL